MAVQPVAPFSMKNAVVQIDVDDYAAAVSAATITPSASTVTWKGLKPASVFSDTGAPTWTLQLDYAQDWSDPDSLSRYLHDHTGQTKTVIITPVDGSGASFTLDVIITPGAIGGAVDQVATASVTLGVDGEPQLTLAAAVPVVAGLAPATGGTAGGTLVKISGRGFTGATDVDFGANPATAYEISGDSVIYAIAPAGSAGTVAVEVTNPTGVSIVTAAYTYA